MKVRKLLTKLFVDTGPDSKRPTYSGYMPLKKYEHGHWIKMNNGERAVLLGSWINPCTKRWDGSYAVIHMDGRIGFWYPSKFRYLGYTVKEKRNWKAEREKEKENAKEDSK